MPEMLEMILFIFAPLMQIFNFFIIILDYITMIPNMLVHAFYVFYHFGQLAGYILKCTYFFINMLGNFSTAVVNIFEYIAKSL